LDVEPSDKKKGVRSKDIVCPFCKKTGHKTRIAKACHYHDQWVDAGGKSEESAAEGSGVNIDTKEVDSTDEASASTQQQPDKMQQQQQHPNNNDSLEEAEQASKNVQTGDNNLVAI
jgi:hypothetical protein